MIKSTKQTSKWPVTLITLLLVNTNPSLAIQKNHNKIATANTSSSTTGASETFRHKPPALPGPRPFNWRP